MTPSHFTLRPPSLTRHTLTPRWGHETRGSESLAGWTRVATCNVTVSLSRSRIVVTPVTGAGAKSRHTGASGVSGVRDHTSRSRRLRSPRGERSREASDGPASSTPRQPPPAPQSTLLRIMLLKSARSQTLSDRPQLPGPGNHLGLSGITCIILATVAPWSIHQERQKNGY